MNVRIVAACLNSILALAPFGLSQDSNQTRQPPSPPQTSSAKSSNDSLPKALLRIQTELRQIAEDINAVGARMLHESVNGSDQTVSMAPKIQELLNNDDPAMLIRDFFHSSRDRLLWESCLKSGKLYRNLAAEIFGARRTRTPESGQATELQVLCLA